MVNFQQLDQQCQQWLALTERDCAHELAHAQRVLNHCQQIAATEPLAIEAIWRPAAWLHDCVCYPKSSPLRSQSARHAAIQATQWLTAIQYPPQYIEPIAHAIEAHSYSAGIPPQTLEAKIVQDADRLDALGAVGLARCLQIGGMQQLPLYEQNDPFCQQRQPDDKRYVVDHFYQKLLHLGQGMHTDKAQQLAKQRQAFLQQFLTQLASEIR